MCLNHNKRSCELHISYVMHESDHDQLTSQMGIGIVSVLVPTTVVASQLSLPPDVMDCCGGTCLLILVPQALVAHLNVCLNTYW